MAGEFVGSGVRNPGRRSVEVACDESGFVGGSLFGDATVFAHASVLALDQLAVGSVMDETRSAQEWLATVAADFPGLTILTGDALYAEQDLCAAVVAGQRDYLLRLKKTNPPSTPTLPSSSRPTLARPTSSR